MATKSPDAAKCPTILADWGTRPRVRNRRRGRLSRSVRGSHREPFWTEWHEDEPWRRVLRPRCCAFREEPSSNDRMAQLGKRCLGLPERPRQIDLYPLAIGELELDTVPAGHEVAVSVGLRDPDAVPVTGTPWTAVMPPACLHCTTLLVGLHGCRAALARALRVSDSFRKVAPQPALGGSLPTGISCHPGSCGWMVSPRASISTNCLIRLALVSSFFAVLMR